MSNILAILAIIAFIMFIIYNIYEIYASYKFYKRMEIQHQTFIDFLFEGDVEEIECEDNDTAR